jgi:hypothetical protein
MANYPPPPPGGFGPPPGYDLYEADRILRAWAAEKGFEIVAQPDLYFYFSWYPFQYLPRLTQVTRELRATIDDAKVFIVQGYEGDPIKQAMGDHLMLIVFATSPKIKYRVAVRSKSGGGLTTDFERGIKDLGGLFGSPATPPGSLLGDPVAESALDVMAPSREEGNLALPYPLRRLLVQGFRGIVETRPQGIVMTLYDYRAFEPRCLDMVIEMFRAIHAAAASYIPQ